MLASCNDDPEPRMYCFVAAPPPLALQAGRTWTRGNGATKRCRGLSKIDEMRRRRNAEAGCLRVFPKLTEERRAEVVRVRFTRSLSPQIEVCFYDLGKKMVGVQLCGGIFSC